MTPKQALHRLGYELPPNHDHLLPVIKDVMGAIGFEEINFIAGLDSLAPRMAELDLSATNFSPCVKAAFGWLEIAPGRWEWGYDVPFDHIITDPRVDLGWMWWQIRSGANIPLRSKP